MSKQERFVSRVHQVAWHRNGIGGRGFHAVVFDHKMFDNCPTCGASWGWTSGTGQTMCENRHTSPPPAQIERRMLGVIYDEPGYVAVFDLGKLVDPSVGVAFGDTADGNSWRGDNFEPELRAAIKKHKSDGSTRVGDFAIPTARRKGRS